MKSLNNGVFYIGADDYKSSLFESQYILPEGMAYNSYLIVDEQTAILDTADSVVSNEWFENLNEALVGREPNYLVVHHLEPDHSALIKAVMDKWPCLKVVASAKAIAMLPQFFEDIDLEGRTIEVKEGDVLDLGSHKLRFIAAPMVHWPEVMMSYDETEGVLYSADAFGKFGGLERCGFYGSQDEDWSCEARRYYFNIVGKYGCQVSSLLRKVMEFSVKEIRPLHGPLLDDNLGEYIDLYKTWSAYEVETPGVFIAVASIHGGTMEVANRFAEILRSKGVERVEVSDLCRSDFAENVEDAFRHSHLVLAAATYDGGLFTPMCEFLHRLKIKGYSNRKVALIENGSWAPCAARIMCEQLESMKNVEVVKPWVTIKSRMKRDDIPNLISLADNLIAKTSIDN